MNERPTSRARALLWALPYLAMLAFYGAFFPPALPSLMAWSVACYFLADLAFPRARTRHLATLLLATAGSLALLFLLGHRMRWMALLLVAPAGLALEVGRMFGDRARRWWRRVPLLSALVYGLLVVGTWLGLAEARLVPPISDDFLFVLRATPSPEPLDAAARAQAVAVVRAVAMGVEPPATPALELEREHRTWVTLLRFTSGRRSGDDQTAPYRMRLARGHAEAGPLRQQLIDATQAALAGRRSETTWRRDAAKLHIQIDLAGPDQLIGSRALRRALRLTVRQFTLKRAMWDLLVYDAEPGVDGFTLVTDAGEGTVLPADPLLHGWYSPRRKKKRYRAANLDRLGKTLAERAAVPPDPWWPEGAELRNFRTYSFAEPRPGAGRTVELFRGNELLRDPVSEKLLTEGIASAGRWLLEQVGEDGRFDYEYFPNRDHHGKGYNEVRHAGSVYGLFHMANLARSEPSLAGEHDAYLRAGLLAMGRIYRMLGTPPGKSQGDGFVTFLEGDDGEKSNSGSPALTLLAFLERPSPQDVLSPELREGVWRDGDAAIMEGLARTLVSMIDDEGKVYMYWSEALQGGGVVEEPLYFPGEVMLALARYHERTGEVRWLEAAQAIGRRQIAHARLPWVVPDHWVMQALDKLDELDPDDDTWRRGAYAMGARFVREQFPPHPAIFPDYAGAYRRDQELPRTTRAASRGEALGGVARIAWRHGDDAERWERALLGGAHHLLEQQFDEDNTYQFARPQEVLGAIRMGLIDNHVRIDNNQHAVVALGNALDALRRREGQP